MQAVIDGGGGWRRYLVVVVDLCKRACVRVCVSALVCVNVEQLTAEAKSLLK